MKHIAKLLLLVAALGIAACAHHKPTYQNTSMTTTSTGYHK